MEHGVGDAGLLLFLVVLEGYEGVAAEDGDGHEVHDGHEGHEQVGQVPYEGQRRHGAEGNHGHAHGAENEEPDGLFAEELDVAFAIVVVASDGAEGEHEYHDGDEHTGDTAEMIVEGELHEFNAGLAGFSVAVEQHDDAGGGGADQHGVHENAQSLYETLLHGVAHVGGGGGVFRPGSGGAAADPGGGGGGAAAAGWQRDGGGLP